MRDKIIPAGKQEAERVRLLTRAMQGGEEAAFREFHSLYSDRLFRYLLVLTRGVEDMARELCQVTMIKVVRSIRECQRPEELWNFLAGIARNSFIDLLRNRKRSLKLVPIPGQEVELAAQVEENHESALRDALQQSLEELEAEERNLIEEFYFDDLPQKTIADQQQTTIKAVESKLARIRGKLRTVLLRKLRHEK